MSRIDLIESQASAPSDGPSPISVRRRRERRRHRIVYAIVAASITVLFVFQQAVRSHRKALLRAWSDTEDTLRQLKFEVTMLDDQWPLLGMALPTDALMRNWPCLDEETFKFLRTPVDDEQIYDGWGNPIRLMKGTRANEFWFLSRGRNGIDEDGKGDDQKIVFQASKLR